MNFPFLCYCTLYFEAVKTSTTKIQINYEITFYHDKSLTIILINIITIKKHYSFTGYSNRLFMFITQFLKTSLNYFN